MTAAGTESAGSPRLMGEDFRDGDVFLSVLGKLGPARAHAHRGIAPAFLQGVEQARGREPFRGGPKQHGRFRGPRLSLLAIAPAFADREDFRTLAPHADACAEFAEAREVFVKVFGEAFEVHAARAAAYSATFAR